MDLGKGIEKEADGTTSEQKKIEMALDNFLSGKHIETKLMIKDKVIGTLRMPPHEAFLDADRYLFSKYNNDSIDVYKTAKAMMYTSIYILELMDKSFDAPDMYSVEKIVERYDYLVKKIPSNLGDKISKQVSEFYGFLEKVFDNETIENF